MRQLNELRRNLRRQASAPKAKVLQRFFKTGPGQYGAGDVFMGVTVPQSRAVARQFVGLKFADIKALLKSKVHEERLVALLMLVHRYQHGDSAERGRIFRFYLAHIRHVNNWDLVDLSASNIVGTHLVGKPTGLLAKLARSKNPWARRIAVLATYEFIRRGLYAPTLRLASALMSDQHDLMHKAVGWMLREVGKHSPRTLERFLKANYRRMPRTMLRYAIERLPERRRRAYLTGAV